MITHAASRKHYYTVLLDRSRERVSSFAMIVVPSGTSEILLRNMKYASRMKYACGILRNEFSFEK